MFASTSQVIGEEDRNVWSGTLNLLCLSVCLLLANRRLK